MEYDVIVLGATFTAAGIATELGEKCLVIERRPQTGYEFFNSLKFGDSYDKEVKNEPTKLLIDEFKRKNAFTEKSINLFNCASAFYSLLSGKNVLLNTEIISIEKCDDNFTVKTHGVSGHRSFNAKRIIDTRVLPHQIHQKSLNFLVDSHLTVDSDNVSTVYNFGHEGDTVVKCYVPNDCSYITARKTVADIVESLPEGNKVMFVADMFDITVEGDYPLNDNGIILLPSQYFANPFLSFDAGVSFAKELTL